MIPKTTADLEGMVTEVARQSSELSELFASRTEADLVARPDPARWSAAGHVAHMCLVNAPYVEAIEREVAEARAGGQREGNGPFRHPRVGSWFARSMEPPPKLRLKTMKVMVPDPSAGSDDVVASFVALQERLAAQLREARGLDLGKIRFGSPFLSLLRLSLGTALEVVLAHNRRHIWLVHETLERVNSDGVAG